MDIKRARPRKSTIRKAVDDKRLDLEFCDHAAMDHPIAAASNSTPTAAAAMEFFPGPAAC